METTALCVREIDYMFTPFRHRKMMLPTRLVLAPVASPVEPADMSGYYRLRAEHSVGLMITAPLAVAEPAGDMLRFFGGKALRAWKDIARGVHAAGPCRMAPLLSHAWYPGGAADMSRGQIHDVLYAFSRAAHAARALGFDAVAINAADSQLIEAFLQQESNTRTDEYGGEMAGRVRFAAQVVQVVRKAVGRRFPLIFRFSQTALGNSASPAELQSMLTPLCESGVDIFACAGRLAHQPVFKGSPLNLAGWTRLLTGRPVITEGSVGSRSVHLPHLVQRMRAQEFDLIAVGRALAADAEWGTKWREAREHQITPPPARDAG